MKKKENLNISEFNPNLQRTAEPGDDFNCEEILNKYGPEGCYNIAKKLMKLADEDVKEAMK